VRHVLRVFCKNIATSGDHRQAVSLAEHLFGHVHVVSSKVYEAESGDLFDGLKMIHGSIGSDQLPSDRLASLPSDLYLLTSGDIWQRAIVIDEAFTLKMCFTNESLDELALCLLSPIDLLRGMSRLWDSLRRGMSQLCDALRRGMSRMGLAPTPIVSRLSTLSPESQSPRFAQF